MFFCKGIDIMTDKLAAVVVTYNRLSLLKKNIEALQKQKLKINMDILIIDNSSTDGTGKYIKELKNKKIQYFNTGKNIGGAGGFNYGIRKAVEEKYKWIWVMDDDTIPTPTAAEFLLAVDERLNGNFGFLSSRVLWKNGKACIMNSPKYHFRKIDQDLLKDEITEITQASFVSFFVRRQTILEVGLPIKDFFIWGDDVEFSRRIALKFKKRSFIVKNSVVYHYMTSNKGSNIALDSVNRIERYRYAYRNEFFLYRQGKLYDLIYFSLKCIYNMMKIILCSNNYKFKRAKVLLSAVMEGKSFEPKIENEFLTR